MTTLDEIPAFALLTFPPFPSAEGKGVIDYAQWQTKGIWLPAKTDDHASPPDSNTQASQLQAVDSHGAPLVDISSASSGGPSSQVAQPRSVRRGEGGILRLPLEDCFKLGQEGSDWVEPDDTGRPELYDVSAQELVISATRDFLQSRHEAFEFYRTKRLFDSMRFTLGLRTDLPGRHWPGSGENGQAYQAPRTTVRIERGLDPDQIPQDEEVCVLLRDPETSVRGYVAMLQRETESGWDARPTFKLAEIIASFFAYINHHKVFLDEPLSSQFATAGQLASQASQQIREANKLEAVFADGGGINRISWAVFGGQYGTVERGNTVDVMEPWPEHKSGGYTPPNQPDAPHEIDGQRLPSLIYPVDQSHVKLLGHIPYARRRIVAVRPPMTDPSLPTYQQNHYQLITVPAPWTDAEGWRRLSTDIRHTEGDTFENPLEGEDATIAEPDKLSLWVESDAMTDGLAEKLVGMGLRGRWGLFGADPEKAWWAFTAKDYVLPAMWYKAESERSD